MLSNFKTIGDFMLNEFITSALIIDDKENEIIELKKLLEEQDIWVKHYTPEYLDSIKTPINNRKIIFLDLFLDETMREEKEQISKIRSYFSRVIGSKFGTYGIVLWTKHKEHLELFKEKIYQTSGKYTPPLFVIAIDKTKYLRNGFSSIIQDLNKELTQDISSAFFIEWNKSVKQGGDSTIYNIYELFNKIDNRERYLEPLLYELAINYSGLPREYANKDMIFLQKELIKSLMDNLQFGIINSYNKVEKLFLNTNQLEFNDNPGIKLGLFSKLNSILLLEHENINQQYAIPGTIYRIDEKLVKNSYICEVLDQKGVQYRKSNLIILDISPPCDFNNSKKNKKSRIIEGAILDYDKKLKDKFKQERFYLVNLVDFNGYPKTIIFDFYGFQTITEDSLVDKDKYKPLLRIKDILFSDILQKISSHISRAGIAILSP